MNSRFALFVSFVLFSGQAAQGAAPVPLHCTALENRQFDFWVGNWQVRNHAGTFEGSDRVTREYGNCTLQEHFRSDDGTSFGSSFSFFNAADNRWHYTWVDNLGAFELFSGGREGRSMILEGWTATPSHKHVLERMTWTPVAGGHVRQLWQGSLDGKHWLTLSDVYYWPVH
jgi:hypothetical protein